jgi:glycosyltransferase involved in cell wall biosynthesis
VHDWLRQTIPALPRLRGLRAWAHRINPPLPRKDRVLSLVTDAFGGYGGIALYNRDMLKALCARPECSEVVVLPRLMGEEPGPLPMRLTHVTSGLEGKGSYIRALLGVLFRNPRFDLIVCAHINLLPLAYLASVVTGSPIILFIYGIDAWKPTRSRLANFLVSRISAFVSISEVTQRRFLGWAKCGKASGYLLPNAIHLQSYAPGPKDNQLLRKYGLAGKQVLMTLGRLVSAERYKGFDEVLEALPELAVEVPNIAYVIAGAGSDRQRLMDKARDLGVSDRVVFTGFVPEERKADLYRLADAYVMPSHAEGFGFVFLEALASGLPAVASKVDGGREALRNGLLGTLVDPDDSRELKRAILEALRKPKSVPEGLEYFSYPNFELRMHRIVDELMGGLSTSPERSELRPLER